MGVKEGGKCVGREREKESLKFDSRTGLSTITGGSSGGGRIRHNSFFFRLWKL